MNTFIVTCSYAPSLDTEQVLTDWPIRHMIDHRWLDHLNIFKWNTTYQLSSVQSTEDGDSTKDDFRE